MLNSQTKSIVLPVDCITKQELQKLSRSIGLSTHYSEHVVAFKYILRVDKIYWATFQSYSADKDYICSSYQEFEELINLYKLDKLLGVNHESI